MTEMEWIPVPESLQLPAGAYWLLRRDGSASLGEYENGVNARNITHYCPVLTPTPLPRKPKVCPFCGNLDAKVYSRGTDAYVRCDYMSCNFTGPLCPTRQQALDAWDSIQIASEGAKQEEPNPTTTVYVIKYKRPSTSPVYIGKLGDIQYNHEPVTYPTRDSAQERLSLVPPLVAVYCTIEALEVETTPS